MKLLISIILCAAMLSTPLYAASNEQSLRSMAKSEHIEQYDVDIYLTDKNQAVITEKIKYNFGPQQKHGIYRDIPIDLHDGDDTYYQQIDYKGTKDEKGDDITSQQEEINGTMRIRLGDADRYVSGVKVYEISYVLYPILLEKNDAPFLNIDAIGTAWSVPINKAKVTLKTDKNAKLSRIECYKGSQGSSSSEGCSVDSTVVVAENLLPYQGVTITAELPKGYVTSFLEPNQPRPINWWHVAGVTSLFVLFSLPFAAVAGYYILRKTRAAKKRKKQIVVAQYSPPENLTPAEVGLLEDDTASMQEITATVIDWAVKGFVTVSYNESDKTVSLTKIASTTPQNISAHELMLFGNFFFQSDSVIVSELDPAVMVEAIATFKKSVTDNLTFKGYYASHGGVLDKGNLTDEGAKQWALVDGFKLYIDVVEKDRLAFSDAPERTPERFNKLLPYAIALGVEKQWTKQFEGIDLTSSTRQWYNGSDMSTFNSALLVSSLTNSIASISTPPSSSNSGFSSSGGSSGGGAGGGGGGSW